MTPNKCPICLLIEEELAKSNERIAILERKIEEECEAFERVSKDWEETDADLDVALKERDAADSRLQELEGRRLEESAMLKRAEAKLAVADKVCEAADSVASEDAVKSYILCFNMGVEMINRLDAWRRLREGGK